MCREEQNRSTAALLGNAQKASISAEPPKNFMYVPGHSNKLLQRSACSWLSLVLWQTPAASRHGEELHGSRVGLASSQVAAFNFYANGHNHLKNKYTRSQYSVTSMSSSAGRHVESSSPRYPLLCHSLPSVCQWRNWCCPRSLCEVIRHPIHLPSSTSVWSTAPFTYAW